MTKADQEKLFSYNDLNGFIQAFLQVQDLYQSVDDFDYIFADFAEKYRQLIDDEKIFKLYKYNPTETIV